MTSKEAIDVLNKEVEKLEAYRGLFKKIIANDLTLEYCGDELKHYYEEIEGLKK